MKQIITEHAFIDAFKQSDSRKEQFTYDGLKALFEYLERLEQDMGEEIEFDMVAICCDYTEYASLKEFQADYGDEYETIEDVEHATAVIKVDEDAFIIQNF